MTVNNSQISTKVWRHFWQTFLPDKSVKKFGRKQKFNFFQLSKSSKKIDPSHPACLCQIGLVRGALLHIHIKVVTYLQFGLPFSPQFKLSIALFMSIELT
jgi:hypothetical protein